MASAISTPSRSGRSDIRAAVRRRGRRPGSPGRHDHARRGDVLGLRQAGRSPRHPVVRRHRRSGPRPGDPARSEHQSNRRLLACPCAGNRVWPAVRVRCAWTMGPRAEHALRPDQGPARPIRSRGRVCPTAYRRVMAGQVDNDADPDEKRGRRPVELRLAGRPAAGAAISGYGRVRGPRARLHGRPELGIRPSRRGTYAGFIEKIPYLVDLGITAVELMPVFQFDALAAPAGLINYWGYQPVSFFAPHAGVRRGIRTERRRGRVPGHGEGAPSGGHRGHPRRGLQPHRRRRCRRADLLFPRPGQR